MNHALAPSLGGSGKKLGSDSVVPMPCRIIVGKPKLNRITIDDT